VALELGVDPSTSGRKERWNREAAGTFQVRVKCFLLDEQTWSIEKSHKHSHRGNV
jgi:hypothetical protein